MQAAKYWRNNQLRYRLIRKTPADGAMKVLQRGQPDMRREGRQKAKSKYLDLAS